MLRLLLLGSMAAMLLTFSAEPARAETFSLTYTAPNNCPTEQALLSQVLARTAHATPVAAAGRYRFDVAVEATSKGYFVGALDAKISGSRSSRRTLDSGDCAEIVAAVAVIMALAMDPSARSGPLENAPPTASEAARDTLPSSAPTPTPSPAATDAPSPAAPSPAAPSPAAPSPAATDAPSPAVTDFSPSGVSRTPVRELVAGTSNTNAALEPATQPNDAGMVPSARTTSRSVALHGVVTPTQTKSAARADSPGRFALGIDGDGMTALAPRYGMLRVGGFARYRVKSGAVMTLVALFGPKTRRTNEELTTADLSYFGTTIELGWKLVTFEPFWIDVLSALSLGRLSAEAVSSAQVVEPRRFDATWIAIAPGLELGTDASWGGFSVQTTVPFGLLRPRFFIATTEHRTKEYFVVPTAGAQVSLRFCIYLSS